MVYLFIAFRAAFLRFFSVLILRFLDKWLILNISSGFSTYFVTGGGVYEYAEEKTLGKVSMASEVAYLARLAKIFMSLYFG